MYNMPEANTEADSAPKLSPAHLDSDKISQIPGKQVDLRVDWEFPLQEGEVLVVTPSGSLPTLFFPDGRTMTFPAGQRIYYMTDNKKPVYKINNWKIVDVSGFSFSWDIKNQGKVIAENDLAQSLKLRTTHDVTGRYEFEELLTVSMSDWMPTWITERTWIKWIGVDRIKFKVNSHSGQAVELMNIQEEGWALTPLSGPFLIIWSNAKGEVAMVKIKDLQS